MKKNKKREDILVSVIVPVFNVEKFLEKCEKILEKLLQNENTIAIVQKQKSGNFFELLWFKKVSGFSVMLFEEPFCNSQSHFYEKRSIF